MTMQEFLRKELRRCEMDWINFDDMPEFVAEVEEILEKEGLSVSEEEVWEVAREYTYPPLFQNIYMELCFMRLESLCESHNLICDYQVNCLASGFSIEGEEFYSTDDFYEKIRESA